MTFQLVNPDLHALCETFIRKKRNFEGAGHQRKNMFNVTCPFTDIEGFRFTSITNSPYDFLDYIPTAQHLFLTEPTLEAFEKYIDEIFKNEQSDWSYFNILKKLSPMDFSKLTDTLENTNLSRRVDKEVRTSIPICIIPVTEFAALEDYSRIYGVKSNNQSLERTQIRLRLNTYFVALIRTLNCTESDIIDVMHRKNILPSKNFHLVCTQKELTYAFRKIQTSGILSRIGIRLQVIENSGMVVKPLFGCLHSNLCQALECLFALHPMFAQFQDALTLETQLINDGKGILSNAKPNRKRKHVEAPRDQSKLPKRWRKNAITLETEIPVEQSVIEMLAEDSSNSATKTNIKKECVEHCENDSNDNDIQDCGTQEKKWLNNATSLNTEIPLEQSVIQMLAEYSSDTANHTHIKKECVEHSENDLNDNDTQYCGNRDDDNKWWLDLFDESLDGKSTVDILAMAIELTCPELLFR